VGVTLSTAIEKTIKSFEETTSPHVVINESKDLTFVMTLYLSGF